MCINPIKVPRIRLILTFIVGALSLGGINAALASDNPFGIPDTSNVYMLAQVSAKCGAVKCRVTPKKDKMKPAKKENRAKKNNQCLDIKRGDRKGKKGVKCDVHPWM